jgi:hypothetical protein
MALVLFADRSVFVEMLGERSASVQRRLDIIAYGGPHRQDKNRLSLG